MSDSIRRKQYVEQYGTNPEYLYVEHDKRHDWHDIDMHWNNLESYINHALQRSEDKQDVRAVIKYDSYDSYTADYDFVAVMISGVLFKPTDQQTIDSEGTE